MQHQNSLRLGFIFKIMNCVLKKGNNGLSLKAGLEFESGVSGAFFFFFFLSQDSDISS